LELGGNVHAQTKNGGTLLHKATAGGQVKTVRVLVEMGTDVHARAEKRHTPRHWADVLTLSSKLANRIEPRFKVQENRDLV
jgi:ankyrin repeat protein